jgi:hypothetical protein
MARQKMTRCFFLALISSCIWISGMATNNAFGGAVSSPAQTQEGAKPALTNEDVVKMVRVKLGDGVIIAKIKSSVCKFDTSTDALIKLKEAGVSDAVMQAVTEAPAAAAVAPAAPPPPDPNDPLAEHDPGIYHVRQNPGGRQMTQLEPTVYSGGKTGGLFTARLTRGISKMQSKAVVRGAKASIRIREPRPTFYFYFERKAGTLSDSAVRAAWFGGLSSPNQFTLARFEAKQNDRELVLGETGAYGGSFGIRDRDVVEFDFVKVAPGSYKVTPRVDMEPGEYCFFYTGQNVPGSSVSAGGRGVGTSVNMGGGDLFDFGVNPAE